MCVYVCACVCVCVCVCWCVCMCVCWPDQAGILGRSNYNILTHM